jgi:hypothetical protein
LETAAVAFCSELFSLLRNDSERNSELFYLPLQGSEGNAKSLLLFLFRGTEFPVIYLPLKASEGNSESLLLFLFRGTEFRDVFSSAEGFGTEFREIFLFRGTAGIPSKITICSVNSVFRRIIFLSEIPSPKHA